jgi:large subunit ribosomal protein L47
LENEIDVFLIRGQWIEQHRRQDSVQTSSCQEVRLSDIKGLSVKQRIFGAIAFKVDPMFLSRILRRPLFAAVNSEASATATSATTIRSPLEDFFEADRSLGDEKPNVYGRGWKASELRLKSWDDLQKLWYVLLKEKNMLLSQRQMMNSQNLRFPNPERLPKVRKSMCRIKHVLTERALQDPDPRRQAEMKRMINTL